MRIIRSRFIHVLLLVLLLSPLHAATPYEKNYLTRLKDGWELFLEKNPEETFALVDKNSPADFTVTVPHTWNTELQRLKGKAAAPETYGCYRYLCTNLEPGRKYALHMKESPGTSSAFYINRKLLAQTGNPFAMLDKSYNQNPRHYNKSNSQAIPLYCEFTPDSKGQAEILVLVSNYYYRKGGLWDTVYLGKADSIWRYNILSLVFYCVVIGSLIFTGLLNLFQFALNKKRLEYFFLGIASFAFAVRIGTAGYCSLGIIFPALYAEFKVKLELLAIWLVPVSILQIIFQIYPSNKRTVVFKFLKEKYLRYTLITIALVMGILSLALPAYYSNRLVPYLQYVLIIFSIYVVVFSISNLIKKKRYSLYNFLSFFTIAIGGITDIIHSHSKETIPIPTLPFFILAFVIIQIIMLAAIQNDIAKETTKASDDLTKLNEAYLRFVPKEFLRLLNKESIIKTKLGDYSNIEMTIMFSKVSIVKTNKSALTKNSASAESTASALNVADAATTTSAASTINAENNQTEVSLDENFNIFGEYLKTVSPIIKKYDGFVSKFLSGGFMALFPNSDLDAVRAALEIKDCIKKLNESEICKNHTITPWLGIHYGKMIIGTIGEENRLDDTVISDTVNTSARIESVCEQMHKNIIISEAIHKHIPQEKLGNIKLSPLDVIYVKGKEKPLQLYEVSRKKQTANEGKKPEAEI